MDTQQNNQKEGKFMSVEELRLRAGIGKSSTDLLQKAIYTSGRRLFPNFSFLDAPYNLSFYKPGDYRTEVGYMGCRTRVMANVADPDKEVVTGRGNLSFTSINLVRLGIKFGIVNGNKKADINFNYTRPEFLTENEKVYDQIDVDDHINKDIKEQKELDIYNKEPIYKIISLIICFLFLRSRLLNLYIREPSFELF